MTDPDRLWRRDQMDLSSDISGLPRSPQVEALIAALDALELTDEQRITALTAYFTHLGPFSGPLRPIQGVDGLTPPHPFGEP